MGRGVGQTWQLIFLPKQFLRGDVVQTYADIETARHDLGFEPTTLIDEGLPRFVNWFLDYHGG